MAEENEEQELKRREDGSFEETELKLKIDLEGEKKPGIPKKTAEESEKAAEEDTAATTSPALSNRLSSPQEQANAANQLRLERGPAKAQAQEQEAESETTQQEQEVQSVLPPDQLGASGKADLEKLKQEKAEALKQAQKKFEDRFQFEKKKAEIIKKFREKALKKAEKYASVAKDKLKQIAENAVITAVQEVGPIIMEIITWSCLVLAGVCGAVDWIGDWAVDIFNLVVRGLAQYRKVKKVLGLDKTDDTENLVRDVTEKFLVQSVLPIVAGTIMESIPWLDVLPWEEIGVLFSGGLIAADLVKSYSQAKSIERQARQMT